MTDLIKALQEASEGSRALDADVWYEVVEKPKTGERIDRDMVGRWPAYTTSLDAITALIGEKSNGRFGPVSITIAGSGQCHIDSIMACDDGWQAFGNTPALACCIALLTALEAEQ